MPERVLVDNDVVLKVACYSLADEVVAATTIDDAAPAMLGVGRFVIRGRLKRAQNIADTPRATACFDQLLDMMALVEPSEAELAIAADLEAEASRLNLELDGGESQLLAILSRRACRLLVTGDKRAIAAMAMITTVEATARVACLEQLVVHVIGTVGAEAVRRGVCAEPQVDRALTSCFGCSMPSAPPDSDVLSGLASYVNHLDRTAPGVLLPGLDLTSLPT